MRKRSREEERGGRRREEGVRMEEGVGSRDEGGGRREIHKYTKYTNIQTRKYTNSNKM